MIKSLSDLDRLAMEEYSNYLDANYGCDYWIVASVIAFQVVEEQLDYTLIKIAASSPMLWDIEPKVTSQTLRDMAKQIVFDHVLKNLESFAICIEEFTLGVDIKEEE